MTKLKTIEQERTLMIQDIYKDHPWRMLISCMMLNCTTRDQWDKVRHEFFNRYPDCIEAERADPEEMAELIAPLGFKNRRTKAVQQFSKEWMEENWKEPIELYGIGKYAQDSWEIFQKGNLNVKPEDGALVGYLKRLKNGKV